MKPFVAIAMINSKRLLMVAVSLLAAAANADVAPGTCTPGSNSSDAQVAVNRSGTFLVGETMGYRIVLGNQAFDKFGDPACTVSNAFVNLRLPGGETIPVLTNIVLNPGERIICPGALECLSAGRAATVGGSTNLFYTNTVSPSQVVSLDLAKPQCPPAAGTTMAILAYTLGGAIVFNQPTPGVYGTATYTRCLAAKTCRIVCD